MDEWLTQELKSNFQRPCKNAAQCLDRSVHSASVCEADEQKRASTVSPGVGRGVRRDVDGGETYSRRRLSASHTARDIRQPGNGPEMADCDADPGNGRRALDIHFAYPSDMQFPRPATFDVNHPCSTLRSSLDGLQLVSADFR